MAIKQWVDVSLPEAPPEVCVVAQQGETHYQAAQRVAAGLQGPHLVRVRYRARKGRGGRRGWTEQEVSYYADGGRVLCYASWPGECSACGGWTPRLHLDPWEDPLHVRRVCLPCLRARLGIPAEAELPPRLLADGDGPPMCSCGGAIGYAWLWEDASRLVLQNSDSLRCARCGTLYPIDRQSARVREWTASGRLKPVCWHQKRCKCTLLHGYLLAGTTCPWILDCQTYHAQVAAARR